MFVKAINKGKVFTKPLLTGKVIYKDRKIINEINTLIVINSNGDILTTSGVADLFLITDDINEVFPPILNELKTARKKEMIKTEDKYGLKPDTVISIYNILIDIVDKPGKLNIIKHEYLDLAIIKFENYEKVSTKNFPVFKTNNIQVGTSICGLGFTFPEYSTFEYDKEKEEIKITNKIMNFPIFPLNGLITRNVADFKNEITMFETSMPTLPGQNGGPLLDQEGNVLGMLVGTKRLSSNYNKQMPFNIDLGLVINSKTIVNFLDQNNVSYNKLK